MRTVIGSDTLLPRFAEDVFLECYVRWREERHAVWLACVVGGRRQSS